MNYSFQGDCIAVEDLKNHSICIKESHRIRNVKHYTELGTETFVMVCNMDKTEGDNSIIRKGEYVRYFKVNL